MSLVFNLVWGLFFLWILDSFFPERFSQDLVFCFPCVAHPLQHGSLLHGLGYCHHRCRRVSQHISEYTSPLASPSSTPSLCFSHFWPVVSSGTIADRWGCRRAAISFPSLSHWSPTGTIQGLAGDGSLCALLNRCGSNAKKGGTFSYGLLCTFSHPVMQVDFHLTYSLMPSDVFENLPPPQPFDHAHF